MTADIDKPDQEKELDNLKINEVDHALAQTLAAEGREDLPQCRICLAGSSLENLTASPCQCSGTMGFLHSSCLTQWLSTRNHHLCEICLHPLRSPGSPMQQCPGSPVGLVQQPPAFLPPLSSHRMDPLGMSMDIAAMFVMAVSFMYLGYALMQNVEPEPTEKNASNSSRVPPGSLTAPAANFRSTENSRDSNYTAVEVTLFCAVALFLILLSTCGNVAIQLLRVTPRPNGNDNAAAGGFSFAAEAGTVV